MKRLECAGRRMRGNKEARMGNGEMRVDEEEEVEEEVEEKGEEEGKEEGEDVEEEVESQCHLLIVYAERIIIISHHTKFELANLKR